MDWLDWTLESIRLKKRLAPLSGEQAGPPSFPVEEVERRARALGLRFLNDGPGYLRVEPGSIVGVILKNDDPDGPEYVLDLAVAPNWPEARICAAVASVLDTWWTPAQLQPRRDT